MVWKLWVLRKQDARFIVSAGILKEHMSHLNVLETMSEEDKVDIDKKAALMIQVWLAYKVW